MLDKDGLTQEVSVGVTYASLMSAVALFFTGVLISQYKSFEGSIKVPLAFLIISTFSFIFGATIYSNAATELTLNRLKSVQRYMVYAKNIDELLGLYLFVLATPMVIGAVTKDGFVRIIAITVALLGFGLYSQSRFSILDNELTRPRKRSVTVLIILLAAALYYYQGSHANYTALIYSAVAIVLLGILITMAYVFCTGGKQYNITEFRHYDEDDAQEVSEIILKNLARIKSGVLPEATIETLRESATPEAIQLLSNEKSITVAEFKGHIAGFACLYGHEITDVYTDPELHHKGTGRQLVEYLEAEARDDGFKFTTHIANPIDVNFWRKIGYEVESELEDKAIGTAYHMKKKLRRLSS
ncbi:MAG TPA: GNAT family N-acetyltransferase [Candidatus Saccharimonadales bacterium]|nr:GNAT family N-acetyltransferase [Candidatus Saccharimonadales bacterium]